jgi:fumarylacetoacetase
MSTNIAANNPSLRSWIEVQKDSDFPIQNLPFGIFSNGSTDPRPGVRIGDRVLDLSALADAGLLELPGLPRKAFHASVLNELMKGGKSGMRALRDRISQLLQHDNGELRDNGSLLEKALLSASDVTMHLPVHVGDYTDFYSSREHATNVGTMFRDPDNALLPNWLHLPVGYHGRSSSIVVSGEPIVRPCGQTKADDADNPSFGPSRLLDFELEMAFITFDGKPLGQRISTSEADEYIFGMVLFNDWSARDIQKWEYVPLGPFLAKNFASSCSSWVVTLDALEPFRTAGYVQEPEVLPYLKYEGDKNIDISLQVAIRPEGGEESVVCNSNYKHMYWTAEQQLAHHTVGGCNIRCGDMMASGTISGPTPDSFGSMLELSWRGTKPIKLADGSERKFIQDGDTVIMRGHAEHNGVRIGFGEVAGKLLPAVD